MYYVIFLIKKRRVKMETFIQIKQFLAEVAPSAISVIISSVIVIVKSYSIFTDEPSFLKKTNIAYIVLVFFYFIIYFIIFIFIIFIFLKTLSQN